MIGLSRCGFFIDRSNGFVHRRVFRRDDIGPVFYFEAHGFGINDFKILALALRG